MLHQKLLSNCRKMKAFNQHGILSELDELSATEQTCYDTLTEARLTKSYERFSDQLAVLPTTSEVEGLGVTNDLEAYFKSNGALIYKSV